MKTLLPLEKIGSRGRIRGFVAIVAGVSMSCLPLSSAFAGHTSGGGGHSSGGHSGGGGGGHSGGGSAHVSGGGRSFSPHGGGYHASGYQGYHASGMRSTYLGRNGSHTAHTSLYVRNNSSHFASHHQTTSAEHRGTTLNRSTNSSRTETKSEVAKNNSRTADPAHTTNSKVGANHTPFDHSMTKTSAQHLMNQRLTQVANRQWNEHGNFSSNHFDPGHGCWFNHGGSWWRCNFWGANWYCNNLIVLGFAPGLCWGWYDDICWGNIDVGMPLDLVDYYYPDPAYSSYGDYDGDEATIYYYPTEDGRYRQVTVIDGKVVDVQIVDQVS